jgi:hypothetical protein
MKYSSGYGRGMPALVDPPLQKTMAVSPWTNAQGGPAETCRAPGLRSRSGRFAGLGKAGAPANSAEEMEDTPGVSPRRLHFFIYVNPAS